MVVLELATSAGDWASGILDESFRRAFEIIESQGSINELELHRVLGNARRLMSEEEYAELFNRIRPEIIELAQKNQQYWMEKYSPLIGDIQNFIYDLYLKGNKIQSGRKNYSEVIGLLISYEEWKN